MRRVLTPREREVVQLAVAGHTAAEMAVLLGISAHTVRNHTRSIYLKWDICDRNGLLGVALQRGVVSAEAIMDRYKEQPPVHDAVEPADVATEVRLPVPTPIVVGTGRRPRGTRR